MNPTAVYVLAALAGAIVAFYFSRAPEMREVRWVQVILVPVGFAVGAHFILGGDLLSFVCFLGVLLFLIVLLGPNIAHVIGAGVAHFLDPHDWTPLEEEIALRPIRRLIDKDQYAQALEDLDLLLTKHRPTYEALLIKAKLLHHFGSVDETVSTLLPLIDLSHTTQQQMAVMDLLAILETQHRVPAKPVERGPRRFQIDHELILFPVVGEAVEPKVIPPGEYDVEEIFHRHHYWLKLSGEDWGNAEMCWEAVRAKEKNAAAQKKGAVHFLLKLHQAIFGLFKRKPHHIKRAEAGKLFTQAGPHIRAGEWRQALPHLQKATALDPDCYEFAYRWVQAVRQTSDDVATTAALQHALQQSQWTEDQQHMLQELKRPPVK